MANLTNLCSQLSAVLQFSRYRM